MAGREWNPWLRLLAMPNESRLKAVVIAFLVSLLSAALVSGVTVLLRPIQSANRAAEERTRIESLLASIPGISDILGQSAGSLTTLVIALESGRAAKGVTPANLEATLREPGNWTTLDDGRDIAGLGQRPDYMQVFLLRDGDRVSLVLLPLVGQGYGGRIDAMLALAGDMNTIAGMAVLHHAETPGLGGRISESNWQSDFSGKRLRDENGELRFRVARGSAASEHQVDGITGATRTGTGVTKMVHFWLGGDGYGPFLDAVQRGEF